MSAREGVEVAFGLGSNIGDKREHIRCALEALAATGIAQDLVSSAFYRTEPWGPVAQDWYVNCCAVGTTRVPPRELLSHIKGLETALGRVDTVRWGPRVIDIDILYYGDAELDTPALTIPHAELLNRAFVLVPLAELRPARRIGATTVGEAARHIDQASVHRLL